MPNNKARNPLILLLGISGLFFVAFVVFAALTVWGLSSKGSRPSKTSLFSDKKSLGVIEVKGVITDSKKYIEQLEALEEDENVKGLLIRVNSPGGAVAPSQELYSSIREFNKKKPVYVSMSSVAASGGYYLACGAKKIFANPGSITGSIGVIMPFMDMSGLYQWAKLKPYSLKTGKYKDTGSPHREMSPDEKKLVQAMLDNVLLQFRKAVAAGRGLSMEKVEAVSDGRIFSGEQAKAVRLVDELGTFNDAANALAKEVGIKGKPKFVYATSKKKFYERLFEAAEEDDADSESTFQSLRKIVKFFASSTESGSSQNSGGLYYLIPNWSE